MRTRSGPASRPVGREAQESPPFSRSRNASSAEVLPVCRGACSTKYFSSRIRPSTSSRSIRDSGADRLDLVVPFRAHPPRRAGPEVLICSATAHGDCRSGVVRLSSSCRRSLTAHRRGWLVNWWPPCTAPVHRRRHAQSATSRGLGGLFTSYRHRRRSSLEQAALAATSACRGDHRRSRARIRSGWKASAGRVTLPKLGHDIGGGSHLAASICRFPVPASSAAQRSPASARSCRCSASPPWLRWVMIKGSGWAAWHARVLLKMRLQVADRLDLTRESHATSSVD